MRSRLLTTLFALMASGLIAAGCGGGGGGGTTGGGGTSPSTTSGSSGAPANTAAADAAKKGCEAGIKNNPALAPDKRDELSKECQKLADAAATGDKAKVKTAYESYCSKLAAALPQAAQESAKSACLQGANQIQ